jgi:hypothetical protein
MAPREQGNGCDRSSASQQIFVMHQEIISELGRATTAYFEATPDRLEQYRYEYEEALRRFDAMWEVSRH